MRGPGYEECYSNSRQLVVREKGRTEHYKEIISLIKRAGIVVAT